MKTKEELALEKYPDPDTNGIDQYNLGERRYYEQQAFIAGYEAADQETEKLRKHIKRIMKILPTPISKVGKEIISECQKALNPDRHITH